MGVSEYSLAPKKSLEILQSVLRDKQNEIDRLQKENAQYKALAQNAESVMDTNKRLAEKMELLLRAVHGKCEYRAHNS